jgi:hypothetical protein
MILYVCVFTYNTDFQVFILRNVHFLQDLYTWDRGNSLTYPIRYHEIDSYNLNKQEKTDADMTTGVDITPTQPPLIPEYSAT